MSTRYIPALRIISCAVLAMVTVILLPASLYAKSTTSNTICAPGTPVEDVYINTSGDVTNTGRSTEGPVCVKVHYNRLRFNISLNFQTTISKGPDVSGALTGTAPSAQPGAIAPQDPRVLELESIRAFLDRLDRNANTVAEGVANVRALVSFLDTNIDPGKSFPAGSLIVNKYIKIRPALSLSRTLQFQALPTDLEAGETCPTSGGQPAKGILAKLNSFRDDPSFHTGDNQKKIDSTLELANRYKCGTQDETELTKNVAVLKFWDSRFSEIGLQTDIPDAQLLQVDVAPSFLDSIQLNCKNIFNQSSSTTASLTVYDESQTLSGNFDTPSAHPDQNFFTLTCASPFAISAGIEFSTIPAREFAIVKSAGGTGNASINKFGLTSDSSVHPLPIALAHVRIWESMDHKFALHTSVGASGNIQGQDSGGSSAEFLMGGSFSFFRTMFITAGLHIGAESRLAGGFKVGDIVPSDVSSVQVTKSYRAGAGFAITFTKP